RRAIPSGQESPAYRTPRRRPAPAGRNRPADRPPLAGRRAPAQRASVPGLPVPAVPAAGCADGGTWVLLVGVDGAERIVIERGLSGSGGGAGSAVEQRDR